MKITICSSARFVENAKEVKNILERRGHEIFIFPEFVNLGKVRMHVLDFYKRRKIAMTDNFKETEEYRKMKKDLMREHFEKIEKSDAVLVLNYPINGKPYIGGNTFLEMGLAFYLGKKIYLLFDIPRDNPFYEEIVAMGPIILKGSLEKL